MDERITRSDGKVDCFYVSNGGPKDAACIAGNGVGGNCRLRRHLMRLLVMANPGQWLDYYCIEILIEPELFQ